MTFRRRTRLLTALFALLSLLFMQLAVAGYACPAPAAAGAESVATAHVGMPCASSISMAMDTEQPALCHAHCQSDKQTLDKHELPAPVAISALPADFSTPLATPTFSGASLQAPHLTRATAPPLAISNCCFRI